MKLRILTVFGCVALALACGPKRIPPGTPAPEYESPAVTPWPPAASAEPSGTKPEPPPAEEPDAGSVDAGEAPASDAGPAQQPL
ncbi:MAG TPA: hypothetical protein VM686_04005 [Polyangiaceae bacterium]|nr:hypothetical protein [Polyangiaceae bacterium]